MMFSSDFLLVLFEAFLQTTAIMKWLAGLASLLSQPSVEGAAGLDIYLNGVLRPLYRISSNRAGLAVPGEKRASPITCHPKAFARKLSLGPCIT